MYGYWIRLWLTDLPHSLFTVHCREEILDILVRCSPVGEAVFIPRYVLVEWTFFGLLIGIFLGATLRCRDCPARHPCQPAVPGNLPKNYGVAPAVGARRRGRAPAQQGVPLGQ